MGLMEVGEPKEVTHEDFLRVLEERTLKAFGLTLEQFADRLHKGELDPESPRVAALAMFLRARTR
jgi:hypothetical protein